MLDRASMVRRLLLFLMTAGVLFGALAIGQGKPGVTLEEGEISPVEFVAPRKVTVVDEAATAAARELAASEVEPRLKTLEQVEGLVMTKISDVFDEVETLVVADQPALPPTPDLPEEPPDVEASTGSTAGEGEVPEPGPFGTVTGQVFLDVDADLVYAESVDVPLTGIDVLVIGADGSRETVGTDIDGTFRASEIVIGGEVIILVDLADPSLPVSIIVTSGNRYQRFADVTGALVTEPVVFKPNFADRDAVVDTLLAAYPDLDLSTIGTLVDLARNDVIIQAQGKAPQLSQIMVKALDEAGDALDAGLSEMGVQNARVQLTQRPPVVIISGLRDSAAELAAADLAGVFLQANVVEDPEALAAEQARVAAEVPDVEVTFRAGETIIAIGEEITQPMKAAVDALDLNRPDPIGYGALALLAAVLVLMLFVYLARFRPGFWASDRRVSLLGLILVLAGLSIRGIEMATEALPTLSGIIGYALPAAGFGFMISIVFDARIAVLAALAIGTMTGVVFDDAGYVIYAALATVAPVPLVSAISNNADQRRAIATTGVAAGVIAFATAWFFLAPEASAAGPGQVVLATGLAIVMGWISSVVGIFLVEILQGIFDITTSLRLLELVDRNHRALQMLQEKAWGTFNHSLMVGTLADRAARSIGANPLLARAAAYYHDIGKTGAPIYFIENQFGVTNPHDYLTPEESAKIIRNHVTDGIRLAREYGVPSEVAEGILAHHGDGIMRYFYETARERYGDENVNVEDFRHMGHKPRSQEMAILMLADALEGATRAIFTAEDPEPERIAEVVEQIVGEKVNDGQLSECALTLGQLTTVKEAFIEALVGHYHHRIPYPNFPELPEGIESPMLEAPAGHPGPVRQGDVIELRREPRRDDEAASSE